MVRSSGRRIALPRVLRQQGEVQVVSRPADRDLEVAERVHPRVIARLNHRRGVELLHDGRTGQDGPRR